VFSVEAAAQRNNTRRGDGTIRSDQSQDSGGGADQSAFRNHTKGAGPCHRGLLRVFYLILLFYLLFYFILLFYFYFILFYFILSLLRAGNRYLTRGDRSRGYYVIGSRGKVVVRMCRWGGFGGGASPGQWQQSPPPRAMQPLGRGSQSPWTPGHRLLLRHFRSDPPVTLLPVTWSVVTCCQVPPLLFSCLNAFSEYIKAFATGISSSFALLACKQPRLNLLHRFSPVINTDGRR